MRLHIITKKLSYVLANKSRVCATYILPYCYEEGRSDLAYYENCSSNHRATETLLSVSALSATCDLNRTGEGLKRPGPVLTYRLALNV